MTWTCYHNVSKLGGFLDTLCLCGHDGDMKKGNKYRIVGKVVKKEKRY